MRVCKSIPNFGNLGANLASIKSSCAFGDFGRKALAKSEHVGRMPSVSTGRTCGEGGNSITFHVANDRLASGTA
eukprot:582460-Amphidinium_carterae.1